MDSVSVSVLHVRYTADRILDEATSALDTETEAAVMEAIDSLQGKMTMLIIAHRLSTIKNCDMVYQVEGGSVTRKEKESV